MSSHYGESLVFVHVGAGVYSRKPEIVRLYKASAKRACKRALKCMSDGECARKAAVVACCALEDDPIINAGPTSPASFRNSNATASRECDAAIMSSHLQCGAAVGCLAGFRNPSAIAESLLLASTIQHTDDRSRPLFLVGDGAALFAKQQGFDSVSPKSLVQPTLNVPNGITDTVGVICIDTRGNIAVASSSAGVPDKHQGRVGPAALIGSGVWVKTYSPGETIGVSCSGMGEDIISLCMASQLASTIRLNSHQAQEAITCYLQDAICNFNGKQFDELMVGCISIVTSTDADTGNLIIDATVAHTTESMAAALQTSNDRSAKFVLSTGSTGKISLCGFRKVLKKMKST